MSKRRNRASRRASARGALFIIGISLLLSLVFYMLRRLILFTDGEQILLAFLETISALLLPAWIGLSAGSRLQIKSFHLAAVDSGKMVFLFLMGVCIQFPVTLVSETVNVLASSFGFSSIIFAHKSISRIVFPSLLLFVILRPIAASLLYTEYLTSLLEKNKLWIRIFVPVVLCTIQTGLYRGVFPAILVSVLFVLCFYQSLSIIAPIMFLAGDGFGQIVFERLQGSGLFSQHGFMISSLLVAGTAVGIYWMRRVWQIPMRTERINLPGKIEFTDPEKRLMIAAAAVMALAVVVAEVLG